MALMFPSKKKSGFKETTLWTNSNSYSSNFASQTINLNCSNTYGQIQGYDYIEIVFTVSTSTPTTQSVYFNLTDFNYTKNDGFRLTFGVGGRMRGIGLTGDYTSSTVAVLISASYKAQTSSQSASNAYVIPTAIKGIKYE